MTVRMRARLGVIGLLVGAFALQPANASPQQQQQSSSSQGTAQSSGQASQTAGGTGQPQSAQEVFRARVDSVSVDASVTDKQGKPVTDLKPEDFEITENKKPQIIDAFKYIQVQDAMVDPATVPDITSTSDQERETAKDDVRLIVIFLDDYHTHSDSSLRIRQPLITFVNGLSPYDLVAVVTPLMPVSLVTFTRDRSNTALAIQNFLGRKYDYQPKYPVEQQLAFLDPTTIEQTRNTVVISALQSLCAWMGTLREGRKTLLYVSEGMTGDVQNSTIMSRGGAAGAGTIGPGQGMSQEMMMDFSDIYQAASRSNTAIYTMDPRGLAAQSKEVGDPGAGSWSPTQDLHLLTNEIDNLRTIAENTGGRAIVGMNDPRTQLKQMIADSSGYYLMSYTSTEKPRDGKFHAISVKVLRPNLQVRARKGYYAYSLDDVNKALAPPKPRPPAAVTEALDSVEETGHDHTFKLWAGAVKGADGKPVVTLAWETNPNAGTGSKTPGIDHLTLEARSVSGVEVYNGDIKPDPSVPTPSGSISFEVPPGGVRIKAVAVSKAGDRLDTINRDVDVPDFTSVGSFITTPEVFSAHTAREMTQLRAAKVAVPTPLRDFARTETLLFRFQAYGPGGTTPTVTMKLLNQLGQHMVDLPAPKAAADGTFEALIGLGSLAAGSYVIEIDAVSGDTKAQALVAVNVTF